MKSPKFQKGDKVIILDGSRMEYYINGWIADMNETIGQIATIKKSFYDDSCDRYGYETEEFIWTFDEKALDFASYTTDADIDYEETTDTSQEDIIDQLQREKETLCKQNKKLRNRVEELEAQVELLLNIEMEWNNYAERRLEKGR